MYCMQQSEHTHAWRSLFGVLLLWPAVKVDLVRTVRVWCMMYVYQLGSTADSF
jgi:hypothetical protein